jgi:hypothetical protein
MSVAVGRASWPAFFDMTLRPPDLASVKVGPSGKMTRPRMGGKEVVA